ncbi:hypothetical protein [Chitinophaga sp.]|uniref:hypothetical protein n=1 Tax=Chitinophaga sp. TaxID=1869181 RepID=UPI002C6B10AB|nr:hypothetical protein [Chitinophaga sp.]HWV66589.1 hypothetical protein [Chitinophaga sp.]
MADKKINQLDPAGTLSANNIIAIVQNLSTGKALQASLQTIKDWVMDGTNGGARVYFNVGTPDPSQGVNGDVAFDIQGHKIYQKASGSWVLQDSYGAIGGMGRIRFTAAYGSGGLSADGTEYTNDVFADAIPQEVLIDGAPLIGVEEFGDTPAFDEWDFNANISDPTLSKLVFGSALPAGARITILYSL